MKKTMTIDLIKQPTGNSCGPTCLKMIHSHIDMKYIYNEGYNRPSIEKICDLCGTDWVVGTPPERMEKGMKALGLDYIEYVNIPNPYHFIIQILESELRNIPLLRTITKGVPHWIIVTEVINGEFKINDPWQGNITYTEEELDAVWKPRNYQMFEVFRNSKTYKKHSNFR